MTTSTMVVTATTNKITQRHWRQRQTTPLWLLTRQGRNWLDSEKETPQSVSISLEEEEEGEEDDAVLDDAYENIEVSILN